MVGEAAEKKLYDAASKGDVTTFQQLLQHDPYLLDGVSFACSRNVLHIAAMRGQVGIVEVVLRRNPQLARDLDSKNSSPLHTAAAQGNVEIVLKLLLEAPEMCWSRDCQDMNPIHIAAMNGHVGVVEELVRMDLLPAMERVHRGQTVLHLCVKHRQIMVLQVLVEKLGELVYAKDDDGETILHLAVRCNQVEMIRYLVESKKIEKQTGNSMDKTAIDILLESPQLTTYREIQNILISLKDESFLKALPKLTDITMVVVVLIATMAYQAAVSPPGGVWQDTSSTHRAGEAVMASTHPKIYKHFVRANTTAFVSSIITIFMLTTGLPSSNLYFLAFATYAMWVSLSSIAVSYGASITVITPALNPETQSLGHVIRIVVAVSLSFFGMLIVCFYMQVLHALWKIKKRRQEDFRTDPIINRLFYSIFQFLKDYENDPLMILRWEVRQITRLLRRLKESLDELRAR